MLFAHLWKRLEARKRYEWDTIEFEEQVRLSGTNRAPFKGNIIRKCSSWRGLCDWVAQKTLHLQQVEEFETLAFGEQLQTVGSMEWLIGSNANANDDMSW